MSNARKINALLRAAGETVAARETYSTPQGTTVVKGNRVECGLKPLFGRDAPFCGRPDYATYVEASIANGARIAGLLIEAGFSVSTPIAYRGGRVVRYSLAALDVE